jgi:hypothetical protein
MEALAHDDTFKPSQVSSSERFFRRLELDAGQIVSLVVQNIKCDEDEAFVDY